MKDLQSFITDMVRIEKIESVQAFGHFPFQLLSEGSDEKLTLGALDLGDVIPCYKIFAEHLAKGAKRIYMSVDFPAGGDLVEDFVAVFQYENETFNVIALPYDAEGTQSPQVTTEESKHLSEIKSQFEQIVKAFTKIEA